MKLYYIFCIWILIVMDFDDIFEVVYDTEINDHANWMYFGL